MPRLPIIELHENYVPLDVVAPFQDNLTGLVHDPQDPSRWLRQFPNDSKAEVIPINWTTDLTPAETVRALIRHHTKLAEFGIGIPDTTHYLIETPNIDDSILYSNVDHVGGMVLKEVAEEAAYRGSLEVVARGLKKYVSWLKTGSEPFVLWDIDMPKQYVCPDPMSAYLVDLEPLIMELEHSDVVGDIEHRLDTWSTLGAKF